MGQEFKTTLFLIIFVFIFFLIVNISNAQLTGQCKAKLSCNATEIAVMSISAITNAHAALDPLYYSHKLCCPGSGFGNSCQGNNETFLKLSFPVNAHVEKKDQNNYNYPACINSTAKPQCVYNSSCSFPYYCLAAISSNTNAHIESCEQGNYNTKVCCRICFQNEDSCTDGFDNDCDGLTDCQDPDCDGSIAGTVKNENNQPISSADINAKKDLTTFKSAITNQQGNYSIDINCGVYNLVASHPDYAPQTKSNINVTPRQQVTADFNLVLGTSCEADCTFAADNIVHASCDGKAGCTFYDSISKAVCDNSQPGWIRDYNSSHYVTCASGVPQPKIEIQASVSCASGTLIKVTRIVVYNGKPVKLIVAVCG